MCISKPGGFLPVLPDEIRYGRPWCDYGNFYVCFSGDGCQDDLVKVGNRII